MKHDDATALVLSLTYEENVLLNALLQELLTADADSADEKA